MKKIITLLLIAAIAVIGCFCFAACQKEKSDDVIRVNEVTHSVFYAPLYVAINKGYFEENGLKIELTNGGGSDKSMTALISGNADIALLGPETSVYVKAQGSANTAKIIGQLTQKDGSFLIGRNEEKNFKWSDLRGKEVIGGRRGGMPAMCLEYAIYQNGLIDGTDVFINYDVQFDLITAAFESGVGDYCTMFEPAASQYRSEGKGYIVSSVGAEVGNVAYTCFMATEKYISGNEDKVLLFMKSIVKAMDFCNEASNKEIAQAVAPSFATTDVNLLEKAIESYRSIDAWAKKAYMTEESFSHLQNVLLRAGTIKEKVAYSEVVCNDVLDEIYKK